MSEHYKAMSGVNVRNPLSFWGEAEFVGLDTPTWAERERGRIEWAAQRRIATLRGIGAILISLVALAIINWGLVSIIAHLNGNLLMIVATLYLDYGLMNLAWIFCEKAFDPNNVNIKRNGRRRI